MRQLFNAVDGRNLVAEVPAVVFRPYVVITMKDLWPQFEEALTGNSPSPAPRRSR